MRGFTEIIYIELDQKIYFKENFNLKFLGKHRFY